jgi:hypothetical protein
MISEVRIIPQKCVWKFEYLFNLLAKETLLSISRSNFFQGLIIIRISDGLCSVEMYM